MDNIVSKSLRVTNRTAQFPFMRIIGRFSIVPENWKTFAKSARPLSVIDKIRSDCVPVCFGKLQKSVIDI